MPFGHWICVALVLPTRADQCAQRDVREAGRSLLQLASHKKNGPQSSHTVPSLPVFASRSVRALKPKGSGHHANHGGKRTWPHQPYDNSSGSDADLVESTWIDSWWSELVVVSVFVTLFLISFCCLAWSEAQGTKGGARMLGTGLLQLWRETAYFEDPAEDQEVEKRRNEGLDEDAYGLAIAVLLRDTSVVAVGQGNAALRLVRFTLVLLLVFVNMSLQIFLLLQVGRFVTPAEINAIRSYYSQFEWHMYGHNMSHLANVQEGELRGRAEFFDPARFASLQPIVKNEACRIPFSQPVFFGVILFIWTLTCAGEMKRCIDIFYSFILGLPTIPSLDGTLQASLQDDDSSVNVKIIVGLTYRMKAFIACIILLPRFGVSAVLLWLGSQWLAATNNFGDLIMNTVALEFILLLKDLLYRTVVPNRNKRDLLHIQVQPPYTHERAGFSVFVMSFLWGLAALCWSILYTAALQNVLGDYKWDVRVVCQAWLQSNKHKQM